MNQLAFSSDGQTLASAMSPEVKLWDARSGDLKQTLEPRAGGWVWALAFSPDNRHLAGYGTGVVEEKRASWLTLWDLRSGAIVHSIEAGEAGGATAPGTLAFSPDGKSVASAGVGIAAGRISIGGGPVFLGQKVINNVELWDVATGAPKWTSPEGDLGQVKSLVYSPDGECAVLLRRFGHQPHRRPDRADPSGLDEAERGPAPLSRGPTGVRVPAGPPGSSRRTRRNRRQTPRDQPRPSRGPSGLRGSDSLRDQSRDQCRAVG